MTDPRDPAEALATIRRSQDDVHRRVAAGSWRYDVTYSLICAGMIGSQALNTPFNSLGVGAGALALALLYRRESRRLGVAVTGMTPPRARWVAIALGMVFVALIVCALVLNRKAPSTAILAMGMAGLSLAAFLISLAAARLWLRVYRRETGVAG